MSFFITENEFASANEQLNILFQKLDFAEPSKQYLILLNIAKLTLQLNEENAISYILQAGLLDSSYEIHLVLTYLALKNQNIKEAIQNSSLAKNYVIKKLDVFSFEELNTFIDLQNCSQEDKALIEDLQHDFKHKKNINLTTISFDEILKSDPAHAAEIFNKMKKESGLEKKYPDLNNLSIHTWEEEFPDRKNTIKEMEILLSKNIALNLEELTALGRMYILENEFEKAAACFTEAKNLFSVKAQ